MTEAARCLTKAAEADIGHRAALMHLISAGWDFEHRLRKLEAPNLTAAAPSSCDLNMGITHVLGAGLQVNERAMPPLPLEKIRETQTP